MKWEGACLEEGLRGVRSEEELGVDMIKIHCVYMSICTYTSMDKFKNSEKIGAGKDLRICFS